jgi:rare lipoprotein A
MTASSYFRFAAVISLAVLCSCKRDSAVVKGDEHVISTSIVTATWYDVPQASLAARRAGVGELTAAQDSLPIGTRLRVTHLQNNRSVVVRVTDRGVPKSESNLDLCRAAAEKLEMISQGKAKVRMEVLADNTNAADAEKNDNASGGSSH